MNHVLLMFCWTRVEYLHQGKSDWTVSGSGFAAPARRTPQSEIEASLPTVSRARRPRDSRQDAGATSDKPPLHEGGVLEAPIFPVVAFEVLGGMFCSGLWPLLPS